MPASTHDAYAKRVFRLVLSTFTVIADDPATEEDMDFIAGLDPEQRQTFAAITALVHTLMTMADGDSFDNILNMLRSHA